MTESQVQEEKSKLTREQVHFFVNALQDEMKIPAFFEQVQASATREPVPGNDEELMVRYEEVQTAAIEKHRSSSKDSIGECNISSEEILQELKEAVRFFPDEETERIIRQMCLMEEAQLVSLCSSTPELKKIAQNHMNEAQNHSHDHGHGHGQCQHNHSHDHGHGHGQCQHNHSHGHGHSHGQCQHNHSHGHGHSHGPPNAEQMMMMQMAMQSLPPALKQDMARIQQNMQRGRRPTAEEGQKMQEIQVHLRAFMATMQRFGGGKGDGQNK